MKKILYLSVICLMIAMLFVGCTAKQEEAAPTPEATPEAMGDETIVAVQAADGTDIVRLESIDLDAGSNTLMLSVTKGKITGADEDYTITYAEETEKFPLAADAAIDFPMLEDLTKTVTISGEELTEEFLAFVKEFDDKPLFTMTQEGDAVKTLTYVYLP